MSKIFRKGMKVDMSGQTYVITDIEYDGYGNARDLVMRRVGSSQLVSAKPNMVTPILDEGRRDLAEGTKMLYD